MPLEGLLEPLPCGLPRSCDGVIVLGQLGERLSTRFLAREVELLLAGCPAVEAIVMRQHGAARAERLDKRRIGAANLRAQLEKS